MEDVAFALRHAIKSAPCQKLAKPFTLDSIIRGEVEAPAVLISFLSLLICDTKEQDNITPSNQVHIKSIADDLVFAANRRKKIPGKHLRTGLALKTMTGNTKVLSILNRLGHSVSYHIAEELETELAYASEDRNLMTPQGMVSDPRYGIGLVHDNWDRYVDTLSGKDTLHDTVGVAYQLVDCPVEDKQGNNEEESDAVSLDNIDDSLQHHHLSGDPVITPDDISSCSTEMMAITEKNNDSEPGTSFDDTELCITNFSPQNNAENVQTSTPAIQRSPLKTTLLDPCKRRPFKKRRSYYPKEVLLKYFKLLMHEII